MGKRKSTPQEHPTREVEIELAPQECRALVQPESIDRENRTVDLIASTGARVRRYNWRDGEYDEELSLDKKHVNMSRLQNGAPLLAVHSKWRLDDVLGIVENARIEGGNIVVTVRFSKANEEAERAWQMVEEGILKKVSIGYRVFKFIDVQKDDDPVRVLRAVEWEPYEVSLVPVGADDLAGVRSGDNPTKPNTCKISLREEETRSHTMGKKTTSTSGNGGEQGGEATRAGSAPNAHEPQGAEPSTGQRSESQGAQPEDTEAARAEARTEERARITGIDDLARKHDISEEVRSSCVKDGLTVEQAGLRMLESKAVTDERSGGPSGPSGVRITQDGDELVREHMQSAIAHRADPANNELAEGGRRFMSMSMLEMGRHLLPSGQREVGSRMELAQRVMASTDYPHLLANVGNKSLQSAYELEVPNYEPFCSRGSMSDFKEVKRTRVGDFPDMQKVNESGEITYGTFGEEAESYGLASYWRAIRFTRQMLINDDLGAFVRLMQSFGYSAGRMKKDVVWGLITANGNMGDGNALFSAAHNNTGSGVIATAGVSQGRKKMKNQKSVDNKRMTVRPAYMLVPTELETDAEIFLRPVAATKTDDINIFSGKFQLIAEPRLDDASLTQWYLAAQPGAVDTIEYAYLDGQGDAPMVEMERDFDTGGLKMKAGLDFAAKALDWRGLYRSSGS